MNLLHDIVFDYTLRNIVLGSLILGLLSGVLGSFAVLRHQGLLGDALSHAALPGIVLAFMLTGSRASLPLLIGAGITGWIGTFFFLRLTAHTRLSADTALAVVLSTFFGVGVLLLTRVQHANTGQHAGLEKYLFGQAASIIARDVILMAILGLAAIAIIWLFFKEFTLLAFDPEFAASLGLPARKLDIALTSLLVIAVMIGLQTVGVVLMSAMIVGPAAAARQWTRSVTTMIWLAAVLGALAGAVGAVISVTAAGIPTGPMVILVLTAIVIASVLFAPERGLIATQVRTARRRRRMKATT